MRKEIVDCPGWKPVGTLEEANAFSKNSAIPQTLYHGTVFEDYLELVKTGWDFNKSWIERNMSGTKGRGIYLFERSRDAEKWASSSRIPEGSTGVIFQVKASVRHPAEDGVSLNFWRTFYTIQYLNSQSLTDYLKEQGYDSASYYHSSPVGREILVFDPRSVMIIADTMRVVWRPPQ